MPFRGFFLLSNSNGEQWEEEREIESGGGRIEVVYDTFFCAPSISI